MQLRCVLACLQATLLAVAVGGCTVGCQQPEASIAAVKLRMPNTQNLAAPDRPRRWTAAFVGDVLLDRAAGREASIRGTHTVLGEVRQILASADVCVCNLECPLSVRGQQTYAKSPRAVRAGREFVFRARPGLVKCLTDGGVDACCIANNHMMDYSSEACEDTIVALDGAGLRHFGAGADARRAREPAVLEIRDVRLALLGYVAYKSVRGGSAYLKATSTSAGVSLLDGTGTNHVGESARRMLTADLKAARQRADSVVVSFHWGNEGSHVATEYQRALAHLCIDQGASAVIGHHPHVLQGVELYREAVIAYSLGNFVFSPAYGNLGESAILWLDFQDGAVRQAKIVPVRVGGWQPREATGDDARRILRKLSQLSENLGAPGRLLPSPSRLIFGPVPTSVPASGG